MLHTHTHTKTLKTNKENKTLKICVSYASIAQITNPQPSQKEHLQEIMVTFALTSYKISKILSL